MSRQTRKSRIALLAIGAWSAFAASASAQTRQYTSPGGAIAESVGREEALEAAVTGARWHAGPLRLDPAFWISDLAWVEGQGDEGESDLTASAGAGLRAYLPVGSKTTFAAFALPEYVWWQEREDERRLNQRFGLGSFTYFNRLSIEVTAERLEDFDYVTGETLERVAARTDRLGVHLEVPVLQKFALFATGFQSTFESLAESEDLADRYEDLDREDRELRGGVRYYPVEELRFGAGVGQTESEFDEAARDRSNTGDFFYFEASYEREKLTLSFDYRDNEIEGEPGSEVQTFSDATGSVRIAWRPRDRFELRGYTTRSLAYSVLRVDDPAYVDELVGVGVSFGLGWRLRLDLFAETGEHSFEEELGGTGATEDVETFGATIDVDLGRRFDLSVGYRKTEIDSGVPGGDSELDELRASLRFGFSSGSGTWY